MGSFASRGTHRVGNAVIQAAEEARGFGHPGPGGTEHNKGSTFLSRQPFENMVPAEYRQNAVADGGPVGIDAVAAAIGEERGTIEDVIEPFLIQQGFLMRTPRGRVVTSRAYSHFGFKPQAPQGEIDL